MGPEESFDDIARRVVKQFIKTEAGNDATIATESIYDHLRLSPEGRTFKDPKRFVKAVLEFPGKFGESWADLAKSGEGSFQRVLEGVVKRYMSNTLHVDDSNAKVIVDFLLSQDAANALLKDPKSGKTAAEDPRSLLLRVKEMEDASWWGYPKLTSSKHWIHNQLCKEPLANAKAVKKELKQIWINNHPDKFASNGKIAREHAVEVMLHVNEQVSPLLLGAVDNPTWIDNLLGNEGLTTLRCGGLLATLQ